MSEDRNGVAGDPSRPHPPGWRLLSGAGEDRNGGTASGPAPFAEVALAFRGERGSQREVPGRGGLRCRWRLPSGAAEDRILHDLDRDGGAAVAVVLRLAGDRNKRRGTHEVLPAMWRWPPGATEGRNITLMSVDELNMMAVAFRGRPRIAI
ncbi:hypothetical protein [Kitasatospora sp. NPDC058478]|uniref:hypothetical protein n=1 Tax=unclassified Kitasatospora TaxID=2633591 RepID=UPI00365E7FC1